MRKILIPLFVVATLFASTPSATAGPTRADAYYTVMCIDPSGQQVEAESVDARAIEQGGKAHAIELFNANHPGWSCWAVGPITP